MTNMTTASDLPITTRIKRSTQFRAENLLIGVMRLKKQDDDVAMTRLLITVDGESRMEDLHVGDRIDLDAQRVLTVDQIDFDAKLPYIVVTIEAAA